MAQSVIGALRVNLGLDSAQFESGAKRVKTPLAAMKTQFLAVTAVAVAAGSAISAMAIKGANDIDKAAKSARRLGSTIGGFRAIELAAGEAGVSLESLTNDVQSLDREIANIGVSGNAERALKALGLQAKEIIGLDADEKLATIADRIKDLGLSTGETTAVLRDLGIRNREMVLLMGAGGAAIRQARQDVEDYGLAISQTDSDAIEQANDRIGRLGLISQYVGQQLAVALVPAMGALAQAMTDSLRDGGLLRTVIDGLAGNLERLGTYLAVAVAGFGIRFVAAMVAAKLATVTLSGALLFLRGALIRTGIGILIVAAGEMVYQFTRLVKGAGSFGEAMRLLGNVAVEVWNRIADGANVIYLRVQEVTSRMRSAFLTGLANMQNGWAKFLRAIAGGVGAIPGAGAIADSLGNAAITAQSSVYALDQLAADSAEFAANWASQADVLAGSLTRPLESVQALRDAVNQTGEENTAAIDETTDSVRGLGDELESSGGGGRGGAALDKLKEKVEATKEAMSEFKEAGRSAFVGLFTGAKSFQEALSELAGRLAEFFANRLYDNIWDSGLGRGLTGIFGGLFGGGGGTGTLGLPFFSFEGGGSTGRGPRAGGLDGKGGYMAMVHPNETVIDHTKGNTARAENKINIANFLDPELFRNFIANNEDVILNVVSKHKEAWA